jgi:hypothetical protein
MFCIIALSLVRHRIARATALEGDFRASAQPMTIAESGGCHRQIAVQIPGTPPRMARV